LAGFRVLLSSRTRHTRSTRDWSSDVCSTDLYPPSAYTRAPISVETSDQHVSDLPVTKMRAADENDVVPFDVPGTNFAHPGVAEEIGRASCREGGEVARTRGGRDRE